MHNPAVTKFGMQVISGGQTGVDIAALRVAQALGLRTGGLAPKGWKTTAGPKPQLKTTFKLEEGQGGYGDRTRKNVEAADATLLLAVNFDSPGTALTAACVEASGKPMHKLQLPPPAHGQINIAVIDSAVAFLKAALPSEPGTDPFVLNVAGNSSATCRGIFIPAYFVLAEIFTRLALEVNFAEAQHVAAFKQGLLESRIIHALQDNYEYYGELDPRSLKGLIV